jgi:hypothetical protein
LALFPTAVTASDTVVLFTPCVNGLQVDINGVASPGASVAYIDWNWGDNTNDAGFFPRSHTYSSQGEPTVTVTAHYNDGSTASSSQTVSVSPSAHSNCFSLTITAGGGGSVFYQASVGSATVPTGIPATLELAYADDLLLTANPGNSYSFSSWSASAGITATGGIPINTTSPSIEIVVNSSGSSIGANFSSGCIGSPSYQLQVSPTSSQQVPVSVPVSGSTSFLIQVIPLNCFPPDGEVSLSLQVPSSISLDLNQSFWPLPPTIQPGSSATLQLATIPDIPPGIYALTLTGSSSGLPDQSVPLFLKVTPGVVGVQNIVTLEPYSVTSTVGCPNPFTSSCFSIQQNTEIEEPTWTGFTYWAQNVILVQQNIFGQSEGLAGFNLYGNSNLKNPIECNSVTSPVCSGQVGIWQTFSTAASAPATWTMTTEIDPATNQLVMTNPFGAYTFHKAMPASAFIDLGYNATVQTTNGTPLLTPELVFVGAITNITGTPAQANFASPTSGTVQSFVEMTGGSWSSALTLVPHLLSDSLTAESSTGLQWTFSGENTAGFGATGIQAEGIGFAPGTSVSNATVGGGVSVDQISSTGVSVAITGSTAPDGTAVTIATANEGAAQPPGTGQLSLGSAGFYDVNVQGISDGTALVCISSSTVSTQTTTMQYWNSGGGSWMAALNTSVTTGSPNMVCGDVPVAALTGTAIAIGPLLPSVPCASDVSTSVTVTRRGHEYDFLRQRFYQRVTLRNSGSSTISVPLALVVDGLSSDFSLSNASGVTACGSVTGSPYILTRALSFPPGASTSVVLEFTNPKRERNHDEDKITYSTRVLAGPGAF